MLVGALKSGEGENTEDAFGRVLAPYLDSEENLFVISSDFCHWGSRFSFTWHKPAESGGDEIWESVEYLDRKGMALVEAVDGSGFQAYRELFFLLLMLGGGGERKRKRERERERERRVVRKDPP